MKLKVIKYADFYFLRKEEVEPKGLSANELSSFCGFDFIIAAFLDMTCHQYCTYIYKHFNANENFYGTCWSNIEDAQKALEWYDSQRLMQKISR